jgi:hypothetical protein
LSLARTVLLSTPSSFASSCTRALPGTALLTSRSCERTRSDLTRALEACSFQGLHRVLIWVVLPCWVVTRPPGPDHRSFRTARRPCGCARPANRCQQHQ